MIYLRGRPDDYDAWAELGCAGWGWQDVFPYFRAMERNSRDADAWHGRDGSLQVSDCLSNIAADRLFIAAGSQSGLTEIIDFNANFGEGLGQFQFTQYWDGSRKGERCSASAAFLDPLPAHQKPHIKTGMLVDRLLVEDGRVTAVVCLEGAMLITLTPRHEIILCAGTFGSPAVLQRSGFGDAEHLRSIDVHVHDDKPGIGANLQDHLQCGLHYKCKDKRFMGLNPAGILELLGAALHWRKSGGGWGSTCFTQSGGYWKTSPDVPLPDIQCHFFSGIVRDHGNRLTPSRGFSGHVYVLDPASRGSVRISTADASIGPVIDPNYLESPDDLRRTRIGLKRLQSIFDQPAFQETQPTAIASIAGMNDDAVDDFIRSNADTAYHPAGTCRMGADKASVVDPELRFKCADGLRIADASVMPRIIRSNTTAACMMIGERAAEFAINTLR